MFCIVLIWLILQPSICDIAHETKHNAPDEANDVNRFEHT